MVTELILEVAAAQLCRASGEESVGWSRMAETIIFERRCRDSKMVIESQIAQAREGALADMLALFGSMKRELELVRQKREDQENAQFLLAKRRIQLEEINSELKRDYALAKRRQLEYLDIQDQEERAALRRELR